MRFPTIYIALVAAGMMAAPLHLRGQTAAPASTNAVGPQITFDSKDYHFGKILSGTIVKHVFIVTNTGDQMLDISRVQPGCHCTTAGDWTHKIAPGQTGEIHIQFDSGSFRGNVTKTITVTSNDKLAPVQTIKLEGNIWRSLEVTPQFAYISVRPDAPSNSTTVVHITNQSGQPVTLSDVTSANAAFKADLTTVTAGQAFDLTVTAVPPLAPGNTVGTITVKTSLTNMPFLSVTAIAMVQHPQPAPAANLAARPAAAAPAVDSTAGKH